MGIYSSIVNEVIGKISSKFIIFLRRDFECKKLTSNQKQLTLQKQAKTKNKKGNKFLHAKKLLRG